MYAIPMRARVSVVLVAALVAVILLALGTPRPAASARPESDAVAGEIIVRFAARRPAAHDAIAARAGARPVRDLLLPRTTVVKVPPGTTVEAAIEALEREPGVLSAEPNYRLHAFAKPSDVLFDHLWGLDNFGQPVGGVAGAADADIDAPEAWDMLTGSSTVVVADLDTGVAYDHPDLAGQIATNPGETGDGKETDGVDNDGNGYVDDWRGWDFVDDDNDPNDLHNHGTHVAGTIGARGDNGIGIAGVNWNAAILPVRFLDEFGSGTMADLIDALAYIGKLRVPIVNGSFGGGYPSDAIEATIKAAKDTLFVFAAGNDGSDNDVYPAYPCSYAASNIVCVAATDQSDRLAEFSNFGRNTVDVAAPGVDVLSTLALTADGLRDGYDYFSGTSMATPHVAGVAALALAFAPGLSTAELKAAVLAGAEPIASLRNRVATGGRVNAERTLEAAYVSVGRTTTVRYDQATKQYLVGVRVSVDESCAQPCKLDTAELSVRATSRFLRLGSRGGLQLDPGNEHEIELAVPRRTLLRARYGRQGAYLVADTRLAVTLGSQGRVFDPAYAGRLLISARALRSGALPGLSPILAH